MFNIYGSSTKKEIVDLLYIREKVINKKNQNGLPRGSLDNKTL